MEDSLKENKSIPHRYITSKGYRWISCPNHHFVYSNGHVPEHRLVWEEFHKASLLRWADVHHKDGDKLNNLISNLIAMMHRRHSVNHNRKDPVKSFLGRSRRKKKWWAKLAADKERLEKSNAVRRANYWRHRDREVERMRKNREKKKLERYQLG